MPGPLGTSLILYLYNVLALPTATQGSECQCTPTRKDEGCKINNNPINQKQRFQ